MDHMNANALLDMFWEKTGGCAKVRNPCSKSTKPESYDGRCPSKASNSREVLGIGEHCYSPQWTLWGLPLLPFLINHSLRYYQAESRAALQILFSSLCIACQAFCEWEDIKKFTFKKFTVKTLRQRYSIHQKMLEIMLLAFKEVTS